MVAIDDSALVVLEASFAVIVVAIFQLIGWWARYWSRGIVALFLAAIVVEGWNYSLGTLGPMVQVQTQAWSGIIVFLLAGILATLLGAVQAWAIGGVALLGVVAALAWGYQQIQSWSITTFNWAMPFEVYIVLLFFILTLLILLVWRLGSWKWIGRVFNIVLITFIVTQAARVIAERDPWSGFSITEIEVFDIDSTWLIEWLFLAVLYIVLYYLAYKHVPWHHDQCEDTKDKVYSAFIKDEKAKKKAKRKESEEEKKKKKQKHALDIMDDTTPLPPLDTDRLLPPPSPPPTPPTAPVPPPPSPHHHHKYHHHHQHEGETSTKALLYPDWEET